MDYTPRIRGIVPVTVSAAELSAYIDWPQLLYAWDFRGTPEAILADPEKGAAAKSLLSDARHLLDAVIAEKLLSPKGVCGVFACRKQGEDIVLEDGTVFYTLRQQIRKAAGDPYLALSDFIKDEDYIGAFAVTVGNGLETFIAESKGKGDDYSAILAQSLSDRLAEAFAEYIHRKIRREIWGYAAGETLSVPELFRERYQGIRPAPGYPCQPDHSEKFTLFKLLDVTEKIGIRLTESALMTPASSVCALCLARPQAEYFSVGKIGADQVADYARRKGWAEAETRKWLGAMI